MRSERATLLGHAPRIKFQITKKHIEEAISRHSGHCVIAEALADAYPELRYVSADLQTIRATDRSKGERYIWLTPRHLQFLLVRFDQGVKPKPISAQLRDGQVVAAGSARPDKAKKTKRARLRMARGGNNHTVPERVGGKAPPRWNVRREFGMRAFQL